MIGAFQTSLLALISAFHLIFSRLCTFSAASQSRAVFLSVISLPEKFLLYPRIPIPLIWSLSKCPVDFQRWRFFPLRPFNCDSFHFPSWILTVVWSSSHPLPSHLFAFKDIAKSATSFPSGLLKFPRFWLNSYNRTLASLLHICLRFPTT